MVVTKQKLLKVAVKHGGNLTKTAQEVGVSHQAISKRLKENPDLKETIQDSINSCLEKAQITTQKVYDQLAEQLTAKKLQSINFQIKKVPDYKAQDSARKDALKLMGHLKDDAEVSPTSLVVMPVVILNGKPLAFNVGSDE